MRLKGIVIFLGLFCYFSPAVADEAAEAEAKYSTGANQCMSCHREGREEAAHEVFLTPMGISGSPDA